VSNIDYKSQAIIADWVSVVVHELFHALGFSAGIWTRNYKNPFTGKAYVPTQNFTERGETVTQFIGPNTLDRVREYFQCPTLNGAEIESSGGPGTAGSHLEMRVFNDAVMAGAVGSTAWIALSPIDLSVLQDSGWYSPNYNATGRNYWGKNKGCVFALSKCVNGTKAQPRALDDQYFCTKSIVGCTNSRRNRAICDTLQYTTTLPPEYQYFTSPNMGGRSLLVDFCPFFLPFQAASCINPAYKPANNYWGETYAANARCMPSYLEDKSFQQYYINQGSACYAITCNAKPSYTVAVKGMQKTCTQKNQVLVFDGFRGNLTCVGWDEVC